MSPTRVKKILYFTLAALLSTSCGWFGGNGGETNVNLPVQTPSVPTIEAAPFEPGEDNYRLITGDRLTLTIQAETAQKVDLFYRPVAAADRELKLKTLTAPSGGNFVHEMKTPMDFNGEVWATAHYPNGEVQQTEHLLLVSRAEQVKADEKELLQDPNGDESERADKFTGGSVRTATLRAGDPNIRISVNVPAFLLTMWQGGSQVAAYRVGVGLREFPIPIGIRAARSLILNPDWVPPDSEWVRSSGVEPYERIPADNPDNPLGKIKIPLGDAYLLHEAQSPSDIGNLVSHGCVRVLRDDIFELSRLIARARNLPVTEQDFQLARTSSDRREIKFEKLIPVDINYDTMVVENGVLNIYPDVYRRNTNTVENLRAELQTYGIDAGRLDNARLAEMLERVSDKEQFVVPLDDIRAGGALKRGKTEPLVPKQAAEKNDRKKASTNTKSG